MTKLNIARKEMFDRKFGKVELTPLTDEKIKQLENQKIALDLLRLNNDMNIFKQNIDNDLKNFSSNADLTDADKLKIANDFQNLLSSFNRVIINCLNNAEMPNLVTKEVLENYKNQTINRVTEESLKINKEIKKYIENNNNIKKVLNDNLMQVEQNIEKTKNIYPENTQKVTLDKVKDYKSLVNDIGSRTMESIQNWIKAFNQNQQNTPSTNKPKPSSQPSI